MGKEEEKTFQKELGDSLQTVCQCMMKLHHPDSGIFKMMEHYHERAHQLDPAETLERFAVIATVLEEQFNSPLVKPIRIKIKGKVMTFNKASTLYKYLLKYRKQSNGKPT